MAGEGGNRTHLSTCIDKPVLKTGRATRPYPPPEVEANKDVSPLNAMIAGFRFALSDGRTTLHNLERLCYKDTTWSGLSQ